MSKFEVIVFNSHGVGQYAYADKVPDWGETLSVSNWHVAEDGGKGTNVAVALGRLGIKTAYVGKVGKDPWGDLGETWMNAANVDTKFLYRSDEVATGTGLILIGPNGENTIIDGDSSSEALTEKEVLDAIDEMSDSEFFVTGFEVPAKLSLLGAKHAHDKGIKVALNPSPLPEVFFDDLSYVDYLFLNENEANILLGREQFFEIDIENDLKSLKEKYNLNTIILTLGSEGSAAIENDKTFIVPTIEVQNILNTAGAGDGFMAATIANMVKGKSLEEAMTWATYFAALSITIDGTIPAYRYAKEVEEFRKKYTKS